MAKKSAPAPNRPQPRPQISQKKTAEPTAPWLATAWEPTGWLRPALIALGIVAVVYLPSIFHEYVNWDDDANIAENPNLEHINGQSLRDIFSLDKGNVIGNYNPLPILTFAFEKMLLGKFNPHATHLINLLLHLGTVFFVIRFLLHLGIGTGGAFIGGLLFGIHPMRVESVAWATERKDVLFAIFFFAALMYYVRWAKTEASARKWTTYACILVLAALAHLSKVQAVTLVLSMYAVDFWLDRKWDAQSFILEKLPFGIMALLIGLANIHTLDAQGSTEDLTNFSGLDRFCIGTYSFSVYLYKLLVPYPMSPLYPYDRELPMLARFTPLVFLGVMGWTAWAFFKKRFPVWVFGIGFFFLNVVFLLQWKPAGQGFLADRFTYVPYFGLFFVAAYFWDKIERENPARLGALKTTAWVVFALYGLLSFRQIQIWENGETLWTHVIGFEGRSISLAYGNRAHYYRSKGEFEKSLTDYTEALTINPNATEHYNSRGKTYFDMAMSGKFKNRQRELVDKAIADYSKGLSFENMKPIDRAEVLANRGAAMGATQQYQQALQDLGESIRLDPTKKNAYLNRTLVAYSMNRYDLALQDLNKILELSPYDAEIYYERGLAKNALKDYAGAIQDLSRAIQLGQENQQTHVELARANSMLGNKDVARQHIQKARSLGLKVSDQDLKQIGL